MTHELTEAWVGCVALLLLAGVMVLLAVTSRGLTRAAFAGMALLVGAVSLAGTLSTWVHFSEHIPYAR